MRIHAVGAHIAFHEHLDEIKSSKSASQWRCFVTKLPRDLYNDPYAQRILLNFIEENYKEFEVYEFAFYWMKTGHIFLLFQGRMKKAHEAFDRFLDFASEGEDHAKPHFELYHMGKEMGWVDDAFEESLNIIELTKKPVKIDTLIAEANEEQKKVIKPKKKKKKLEEEEEEELRSRNAERSMRVRPILLVVEDERMTQSFIEALTEPYCDVIIADTIAQGYDYYQRYWPNIVFMDIELPDGDGQDLTEQICEEDPESYVVMVSANISTESIARCKSIGAKGFVAKPVTRDRERLLSMINLYNRSR